MSGAGCKKGPQAPCKPCKGEGGWKITSLLRQSHDPNIPHFMKVHVIPLISYYTCNASAKTIAFYMLCLVSISNKCLASVPRQNINRIGRHLRKCLIPHRETWGVGESFVVRLTLVRWVSDVLLRKNWSSFGFCPNEGGKGPAQIFCHILKRCIFGQFRGLFLPKCQ